jgi:hypothetical protein
LTSPNSHEKIAIDIKRLFLPIIGSFRRGFALIASQKPVYRAKKQENRAKKNFGPA